MTNKRFLVSSILAILVAMVALAGNTTRSNVSAATEAATMAGMAATPVATVPLVNGQPQTLHVWNFTTYIADDTIANFEKLYNVKVTYDTYTSFDEVVTKIQSGNPGYDIVVGPDYQVTALAKGGFLEKIDLNNIPNFTKYASAQFKNPAYDPGNQYSVAYQWGTIGLGYNKAKTGRDLTSWADLFDDKFKGRIGILKNSRETIATFLIYLGKDPNSTNIDDLRAVKDLLIKNKDKIATFHDSDGQFKVAKGELDVISDWSGDFFQVMADPANKSIPLTYTIPKEGAVLWTDNMMVLKGAPNKALAQLFMNYVYDPAIGASISNYTQYGSPNQGAIDMKLIDSSLLTNPAIYPPEDVAKKLVILKDIGDAQADYDQVWQEILAGASQ